MNAAARRLMAVHAHPDDESSTGAGAYRAAADVLKVRDAALRSHTSQVAPDSVFSFWPSDILRQAWPTGEFQLIDSKVETEMPETDLFAGVVPE